MVHKLSFRRDQAVLDLDKRGFFLDQDPCYKGGGCLYSKKICQGQGPRTSVTSEMDGCGLSGSM